MDELKMDENIKELLKTHGVPDSSIKLVEDYHVRSLRAVAKGLENEESVQEDVKEQEKELNLAEMAEQASIRNKR